MIRWLIVSVLLLLPAAVLAQSKMMINGVDSRIAPLENQFLAQQLADKAQQVARAVATLSLEQQDHKDAEAKAANLQQWLDLAWPAYEATTK